MHLLPDVDDSTDSSFQIGSLDFSEGAVAALLLDQVNSVTCSLVSAELSNVGKPIYNQPRPYRNEYYAVLKIDRDLEPEEKPLMDLVDEIYSLRPLERIQEQIVEDSTVETYWSKLFEKFLISERNDEE